MLQDGKLNKINNGFGTNSLNGKSDFINVTMKEAPKHLVILFNYMKLIMFFEVVIVFVFGYFFLISPKLKSLSESQKLIETKNQELQSIKDYETKSSNLEEAYKKIKQAKSKDLVELKNILPQEGEIPELIAQIEALTLSQNLILGNITINGDIGNASSKNITKTASSSIKKEVDIADDVIKELEVTVSIIGGDGTYEKVKKLLDSMENHIRLIDINSFSFDEKMTSYSIVFKTYYLQGNEK